MVNDKQAGINSRPVFVGGGSLPDWAQFGRHRLAATVRLQPFGYGVVPKSGDSGYESSRAGQSVSQESSIQSLSVIKNWREISRRAQDDPKRLNSWYTSCAVSSQSLARQEVKQAAAG